MLPDLQLFSGDCIEGLTAWQEPVDLYVTSLPYNAGIDYGRQVDDARPWPDYYRWVGRLLRLMHQRAAQGARAVLVMPYQSSHSGKRSDEPHKEPLAANTVRLAMRAGWQFREWIPWRKFRHNPTSSTAWGDPRNPSSPHYCAGNAEEAVLVLHKGSWIKRRPGMRHNDITADQWTQWLRAPWDIPPDNDADHPAKFALQLAVRPILLYTYPGDLVCDPVMGSGTVAEACYRLGRRFVGWDIVPAYLEVAKQRLLQNRLAL